MASSASNRRLGAIIGADANRIRHRVKPDDIFGTDREYRAVSKGAGSNGGQAGDVRSQVRTLLQDEFPDKQGKYREFSPTSAESDVLGSGFTPIFRGFLFPT